MRLSELFRRLSFGELSNLSLSGSGSGAIITEKQPQIIQYTNEGLLRLYSRFVLSEKDVIVELVEGITHYHLRRQFAEMSGSTEPHAYIKDLPDEPFEEDVIKILSVMDSSGNLKPLNDQADPASLFTPQPDTLQVPNPVDGLALGIVYQARHRVLQEVPDPDQGQTAADLLNQKIQLPFSLEGALTSFIGSKVFSHMNGQENMIKGQEYMATYEAICLEVADRDLVSQSFHTSQTKLEQRGFV